MRYTRRDWLKLAAAPGFGAAKPGATAKITAVKTFYVGFVYVKVETDAGVFGVGDGSCSGRDQAVMRTIESHFAPALIGRDPTRIEFIWQDIYRGNFWVGGPVLQSALSGIDMALWDIFGKLTGLPVYRLLGGAARDKVLIYEHIYGTTVEELVATAKATAGRGTTVLRMAPPEVREFNATSVTRESVKRVSAVRAAVGDDVELAFDAHTRFTPSQGIDLCERLAPFRPYFVEDPVRADSMSAYRLVRRQTKVPLAAGEQLNHLWGFRELIEEELVDYLRVDLSHSGGISEARKIAAMGEAHHQELVTHHTGSPVNAAANAQLNLFIPNCAVQEYARPGESMLEITPDAFLPDNGYLLPRDAPGLGIQFNEGAARAADKRLREKADHRMYNIRRPDGSVNNW